MARRVDIDAGLGLGDYEEVAHLAPAVHDLRAEAERILPRLSGRTLWMVSSTAQGGGVAEMLPTVVALFRELGLDTEWVVVESEEPAFFRLTKRLHNLIHGEGEPGFGDDDRALFEKVAADNGRQMLPWLSRGDVVVVHDPQPMALPLALDDELDLHAIWRCHIGLDDENEATRSAWEFLGGYAGLYRRAVFSAPEYIPDCFRHCSILIHPAINPLTHKNRELSVHKLVGILGNSALAVAPGPVLTPMYRWVAQRLQPTGEYAPANMSEDIGLLSRPIVSQVSRWDRLKGWRPLLEGFSLLKERARRAPSAGGDHIHERRLELVRLVLAGPDPAAVADDPEGVEVLGELRDVYLNLPPHVQRDVALVALPMADRAQNALMVNAIQRSSSIVVQNSLREGFGLTVTEGMWKRVPVLTNQQACGPRHQVRQGLDGVLVDDPSQAEDLCTALDAMLEDSTARDVWGRNAQRRVHREFLIFGQVAAWIRLLGEVVDARHGRAWSPRRPAS